MEIANKKALVFGGTSGIGLSTCEQLIEKGADVIAISRDPSKANSVKPVSYTHLTLPTTPYV